MSGNPKDPVENSLASPESFGVDSIKAPKLDADIEVMNASRLNRGVFQPYTSQDMDFWSVGVSLGKNSLPSMHGAPYELSMMHPP